MAERSRLQVVEEIPDEPVSRPHKLQGTVDALATETLMLALKGLSQRAKAAAKDLFTLLSAGSAWWLWWSTPDPSNTQIVSLTLYALFVLALNVIVRKVH